MKMNAYHSILLALLGSTLLLVTISAAPMDTDEEPSENGIASSVSDLGGGGGGAGGLRDALEGIDSATLRKLLMQLDAGDERFVFGRASRGWAQEPRGWDLRPFDARVMRPWRADKRQVRFRQCYFNPISCFRK